MLLFILLSHAILFNHFNCVRVAVFYLFRCCRSCLLFKPQNNNHALVVAGVDCQMILLFIVITADVVRMYLFILEILYSFFSRHFHHVLYP